MNMNQVICMSCAAKVMENFLLRGIICPFCNKDHRVEQFPEFKVVEVKAKVVKAKAKRKKK